MTEHEHRLISMKTHFPSERTIAKSIKNHFYKNDAEVELKHKLYLVNEFIENSYIGDIEIFNKKKRQEYAIANEDTHLMVLSKTDIESIMKVEFPLIYTDLKKTSDKRLEADMEKIQDINCLIEKFEKEGTCSEDRLNMSETSVVLENEEKKFKDFNLEALFESSDHPFGIEEVIEESAFDCPNLTLTEIMEQKELPMEQLASQFEGKTY